MTHLKVTQSDTSEMIGSSSNQIGAKVIKDLYEKTFNGVDNTSELSGVVSVDKAHRNAVEYLQNHTDLRISVTGGYYIDFEDTEVERVLLQNSVGDGFGITEAAAAAVTTSQWGPHFNYFYNNTDITTFNELKYFTQLTTLHQFGMYYSPKGIFAGCTSLVSVDLSNVTIVAEGTFSGCTSLKNLGDFHPVKLNWDDRGDYTFQNCQSLETVDLSNVPSIPGACFQGCLQLSNITNLNNVTYIGANAFYRCENLNIDVSLPKYNVSESNDCPIQFGAFDGTNITSISNLGKCTGIVGDSLYIGRWEPGTFAHCTSLRYAILPETITYIGMCAFCGDSALEYIKLQCTTPPTLNAIDPTSNAFPFYGTTCNFYVPDAAVNDYKAASGWDAIASRIFPMSQFSIDFPNE